MAPDTSADVTPNPKQIVFVFMAATVVAVVVFLCGVLVGRGVPLRPVTATDTFEGAGGGALFGDTHRRRAVDSLNGEPMAEAITGDDLTYYRRLQSDTLLEERLVEPEQVSPPPPLSIADAPEPVMARSALELSSPAPPPVDSTDSPLTSRGDLPQPVDELPPLEPITALAPSRSGFTVQVTALREREVAQEIADRLSAKGFPAFVVDSAPDAPVAVFRVRVGRYPDRRDAERVLHRLESEEHYKPWITR